jgi:hypothetical protein
LDLYRNQSILVREFCPNEESTFLNSSTSQIFTSSNGGGRMRMRSTSSNGSSSTAQDQKINNRIFSGKDQQNKNLSSDHQQNKNFD